MQTTTKYEHVDKSLFVIVGTLKRMEKASVPNFSNVYKLYVDVTQDYNNNDKDTFKIIISRPKEELEKNMKKKCKILGTFCNLEDKKEPILFVASSITKVV